MDELALLLQIALIAGGLAALIRGLTKDFWPWGFQRKPLSCALCMAGWAAIAVAVYLWWVELLSVSGAVLYALGATPIAALLNGYLVPPSPRLPPQLPPEP